MFMSYFNVNIISVKLRKTVLLAPAPKPVGISDVLPTTALRPRHPLPPPGRVHPPQDQALAFLLTLTTPTATSAPGGQEVIFYLAHNSISSA